MGVLLAEFDVDESACEEIGDVDNDVILDHFVKHGLLAKRLACYVFPNNIGNEAAYDLNNYFASKPKYQMTLHFKTQPKYN